jgi:DNA-binding NtrC family response regulator
MKILVVDDEEIKRVSLVDDMLSSGHQAIASVSGEDALELLAKDSFDVVVTDLRMPGIDGIELLKRIKRGGAAQPEVIIMTAYGSIPMAVEAMKIGAFDFITKPFMNEAIFPLLERIEVKKKAALESVSIEAKTDQSKLEHKIVGNSPAMCEARKMVELCARTDATVLLTGETGTGKDLVANTIHELSHRHGMAFVNVDCAAFSHHLIENELYGHEKGAFTGADQRKKGKFDMAQKGTLYLDNVDDIPKELQIKLLRVIDEKVFERVGATDPIKVDVKIIAATKKNLLLEVENGAFRSDLYYRLNVLRIDIPALRHHLDDLPVLVDILLKRISRGSKYSLDSEAIEFLRSHNWPGNVRELVHTLERAFLVGNGIITAELLSCNAMGLGQSMGAQSSEFKAAVMHTERELLQQALRTANGNKSAAARSLGMKMSTFRDKLIKHNLS